MKSFYRLVNPLFELEGKEYDTMDTAMSPRMHRTIELSPLFNIAFRFWQRTGVQLSTAVDAIIRFPDYLEDVKSIELSKGEDVSTSLFNHHETIPNVPFQDVKTLMLEYYDLYNEKGLSLGVNDLPYIWEFLWEAVRKNLYANKTSRFLCLFLYDNPDQAQVLQDEIDQLHQNTVVEVLAENKDGIERYDAGWLDIISVNCTFNEYIDYCRSYWEGKESKCPNWEYLYVGKYRIKYIN